MAKETKYQQDCKQVRLLHTLYMSYSGWIQSENKEQVLCQNVKAVQL